VSAPDVDPMDVAAAPAGLLEGRPLVVHLSHAKRIRDKAVAAERANYEGAMADLHALVEVARKAVKAVTVVAGPSRSNLRQLSRFLDANYPKEADRG
jgi:hypothetical protein